MTGGGGFGGGGGGGRAGSTGNQDQYEGKHGVFISHAAADRKLADAFVEFLEAVCAHQIKCVQSSSKESGTGIPYGAEWYPWIKNHVERAKTVVVLLTPESAAKPWILFEAGLAKAVADRNVIVVAVFMDPGSAFVGPFAALQGLGISDEDLKKLAAELQKIADIKQSAIVVETLIKGFYARIDEIKATNSYDDAESAQRDPVVREVRELGGRISALERAVEILSDPGGFRRLTEAMEQREAATGVSHDEIQAHNKNS